MTSSTNSSVITTASESSRLPLVYDLMFSRRRFSTRLPLVTGWADDLVSVSCSIEQPTSHRFLTCDVSPRRWFAVNLTSRPVTSTQHSGAVSVQTRHLKDKTVGWSRTQHKWSTSPKKSTHKRSVSDLTNSTSTSQRIGPMVTEFTSTVISMVCTRTERTFFPSSRTADVVEPSHRKFPSDTIPKTVIFSSTQTRVESFVHC